MGIQRFNGITLLISVSLFLHCGAEAVADPLWPPPLGRLVDVGGYRVHLYCTGTGNPTVMVVGGGFSFDWGLVQPKVAALTHVCTYDPSGTAWSDSFPMLTTKNGSAGPTQKTPSCSERVEEIHRLLKSAAVNGPYVLVGFSIGGLFARLYAHSYPEEVVGMVLVDHAFIDPGGKLKSGVPTLPTPVAEPDNSSGSLGVGQVDSPPILISKTPITLGIEDDQNFKKLPLKDRDLHSWAMAADPLRPTPEEAAECVATLTQATSNRPYPLSNLPLIVISTSNDSPNYRQLQRRLLSLSRNSRQVVAENSSHMVIVDQPDVIALAIEQVVAALRNHAGLPK